MQKEDIRRLEAFEIWLWRKILKVNWTEHKTNEEVLEMVQEKRMLIKTIRDRQKNWVWHVLRSDSLLRTVWDGRKESDRKTKNESTRLDDTGNRRRNV